jgi:hypothetical protein
MTFLRISRFGWLAGFRRRRSGERDGRAVTVRFPYERVACSQVAGVRP